VAATTLQENLSPPAPVTELGVVRRAPNALIVYWRKNPEPDVSKYLVFREQEACAGLPENPVATVDATQYFLQTFRDEELVPGTRYLYKVVAEDSAGNRQAVSPVTSATTPVTLADWHKR